jgi:hypothetical protein
MFLVRGLFHLDFAIRILVWISPISMRATCLAHPASFHIIPIYVEQQKLLLNFSSFNSLQPPITSNRSSPNILYYIVARMWRLYKTGIGFTTVFIGLQVSYTLTIEPFTIQLTLTTESQLLLSFSRAQVLLQTQMALTGHQLTLLYPSSQLTVN